MHAMNETETTLCGWPNIVGMPGWTQLRTTARLDTAARKCYERYSSHQKTGAIKRQLPKNQPVNQSRIKGILPRSGAFLHSLKAAPADLWTMGVRKTGVRTAELKRQRRRSRSDR